jgi:hypothetical protein
MVSSWIARRLVIQAGGYKRSVSSTTMGV